MIIVWAAVETTEQNLAAAMTLSLNHVRRSRLEPGCLHHSAQIDAENPLRIMFYEEWQDLATIQTHFAVPESGEFVRDLAKLATSPPQMKLFQADAMKL